jgi:hypothetical protein
MLEKRVDFGDREHLREHPCALRPFQHRGRIVSAFSFSVEKSVDLAYRRQAARLRRCLQPAPGETRDEFAQVVGCRIGDRALCRAQMRRQIIEIVPVGGKRIRAGAAFGCEHVEK